MNSEDEALFSEITDLIENGWIYTKELRDEYENIDEDICPTINTDNIHKLRNEPVGNQKIYLLMTLHGSVTMMYNDTGPYYVSAEIPVDLCRLKATQLHSCSWGTRYNKYQQIKNIIFNKQLPPPYNDYDVNVDEVYLQEIIQIYKNLFDTPDEIEKEGQNVKRARRDLFEIPSIIKTDEKYEIITNSKNDYIINKFWNVSSPKNNQPISSYYEGIYFCADTAFQFPLPFDEDFQKILMMVFEYIDSEQTYDDTIIYHNDHYDEATNIITYHKYESLITCPYFIAYTLFITTEIESSDDLKEFITLTSPYDEKGSEKQYSIKEVTAENLYGYFRLCNKVISIDKSCENLQFWHCGKLREIFSLKDITPEKKKLMIDTYKQIQTLRDEAIQDKLRGGKLKRRKNAIKKKKRKTAKRKTTKRKTAKRKTAKRKTAKRRK